MDQDKKKSSREQDSKATTQQRQPHRQNLQDIGKNVFDSMVNEFAHNAYVNKNEGLDIELGSDSNSENEREDGFRDSQKGRKKKKKVVQPRQTFNRDDLEMGNIFQKDENKMDLINNLNSIKLLSISEKFNVYPDQDVTLDEFVQIMTKVMAESSLSDRDNFIESLVDLFYRAKQTSSKTIKFEQLTAYLIEHEIEQAHSGTQSYADMRYTESTDIKDKTTHNNYIEKIFYFQQIDKVILFEQSMRLIRIYHAPTMKWEKDIQCVGVILAIEYCPDKNAIAVSLSDRTIIFFDTANQNYKIVRRMHVPSTQKCLIYVKRKKTLFSAGVDGAIFAWNLDTLFSNDFVEQQLENQSNDQDKSSKSMRLDKEKKEYIKYIAERTPWFVGDIILCMIDLPNINQLATGSYDAKIRLWDLRTNGVEKQKYQSEKQKYNEMDQLAKNTGLSTKTSKDDKKPLDPKQKKNAQIKQYFGAEIPDELLEDFTKQPVKTLSGHNKAVREIAYSEKHKIIVSCGFDFEVFVWNPYLEEKIMKLDGHEQPLVGVNCLSSLNSFITADAKGMVKVWSILDYSCIQTFYVPNVNQVTCIRAVPKHRRLICGSRQFKVFQYNKPFMQEYSDDHPITCAKFSPIRFEIYVAGERSIKVWDARTGKPVRVLKNVLDSDITCMELDTYHRKIIVGSHQGEIKVFDILSGVNTLQLDSHDPQEGEISYIGYAGDDHTVITAAWDKVIKVHMDEKHEHGLPPAEKGSKIKNAFNVLRGRTDCHSKDIICGDFAVHLDLIATGGRDNTAKIWDYERIMMVEEIKAHKAEVTLVRFIKPFPLLLTTDINGQLYIWLTKPHPQAGACIVNWRNNFTLKKNSPITAIDTYYNPVTGEFLLFIGDEMGSVKIQDLSAILKQRNIPIKPVNLDNVKRNPYRVVDINQCKQSHKNELREGNNSESDDESKTTQSLVNESEIVQIAQWIAHQDVVKSVQYISVTDEPLVFTASLDRMVTIWNMKGETMGTLSQGYMTHANYLWNFELQNYDNSLKNRQDATRDMLDKTSKEELNEKRREKFNKNNQSANTSLQFAGSQLLGMQNTMVQSMNSTAQQWDQRNQKAQDVANLVARGRKMVEVDKYRAALKQKTTLQNDSGTPSSNQRPGLLKDFSAMQAELMQSEKEKQDRNIGPFAFDYDDDIESEVLTSEQVYRDLKELDDILGKNDAMRTEIRGKAKR